MNAATYLPALILCAANLAAGDALAFYGQPYLVDEMSGGMDIMVTRTGTGVGAISVDTQVGGGLSGAALGVDFQAATPGTLTWVDGDRSYRVVHIPVLHDPAFAPWHSLAISLVNPGGGAVLDPDLALVHVPIAEHETNPAGYLSMLLPDTTQSLTLQDDAGNLQVMVTRSGGSLGAVTALCSLVDLSAVAGTDFTVPADPTLSWADGETGTKSLLIPIIPRSQPRGPLEFSCNVYPDTGGAGLGVGGANVTITDHIPAVAGTMSCPTSLSVSELAGSASFLVSRTGGSTGAVSVDWLVNDSTALAGTNYVASGGTLHWADGDSADKTITIPLLADEVVAPTLYAYLTYGNPTGGLIIPPYTGTSLSITDGDGVAGLLDFADSNVRCSESDGQVVLVVTRTGGSTGAISVDWASQDGSAISGVHYTGGSGTLTWADGDHSDRTLAFPLIHDGTLGPVHAFYAFLSNPTGGAAINVDWDSYGGTVTIDDSDCQAGSIAWRQATTQVHETAGSVILTASRAGGSVGPVSAPVTILDMTACLGVDYGPADLTTLTWADGDTADKSVTIPIIHDGLPGTDRAFRVFLGPGSSGAGTAMPNQEVVTILEDDQVLALRVASGAVPNPNVSTPAVSTAGGGGGGCGAGAAAALLGLACAMIGLRRR